MNEFGENPLSKDNNNSSYLNIYKADYENWNDVLNENERIPVN